MADSLTTSPGPWQVEDGFGPRVILDRDGRKILEVSGGGDVQEAGNAALVARAHEMLTCLREAEDVMSATHRYYAPKLLAATHARIRALLLSMTGDTKYTP